MRKPTTILFTCLIHFCLAQKIEKFYDWNWKECDPSESRFYTVIESKNGLWTRNDYFIIENSLQMNGTYKDKDCKIPHGEFHFFHPNEKLESTGKFVDGKKEGVWLSYYDDGMISDSAVYLNGNLVATRLRWYPNGYPKDSTVYSQGGIAVEVGWFDDGSLSSAGRYLNEKMNGKWQFFHKNGNPSAIEVYDNGVLRTREYYDENGKLMKDTANTDREASFPGGKNAWMNYMLKHLYFPDQYKITNSDRAIVVLSAVIDEDGTMTDVTVTTPFYAPFNEIALKMMKNSPKWIPAVSHNRKIKYYIHQPVTFQQE